MSSGAVLNSRWWLIVGLFIVSLSGCLSTDGGSPAPGDDETPEPLPYGGAKDETVHGDVPTGYLPPEITGLTHRLNPDTAHAYTVFANDDVLYVGGSAGLRIYDLSDPASPVPLVTDLPNSGSHDLDLMFHPDGRLLLVTAAWGDNPVRVFDVTDPTQPSHVMTGDKCTHNIAVVPDTTLVYSSFSACHTGDMAEGDASNLAITDLADPENHVETLIEFPRQAMTVGGVPRDVTAISCHHTTFQPDRDLMYCAGITQTLIFDISDPMDPQIIQVIDWPGTQIHHAVWPAWGGDLLLIGDEATGAYGPTPTCSKDADVPTSALWFYDLSDLANPLPLGFFEQESYDAINEGSLEQTASDGPALQTATYCSTHFGGFVEDQDLFIISWYNAGTYMLDFSDPSAPFQVGGYRADGPSTTMDAIYYKGHVYTADEWRGVDVLQVT